MGLQETIRDCEETGKYCVSNGQGEYVCLISGITGARKYTRGCQYCGLEGEIFNEFSRKNYLPCDYKNKAENP